MNETNKPLTPSIVIGWILIMIVYIGAAGYFFAGCLEAHRISEGCAVNGAIPSERTAEAHNCVLAGKPPIT